MGRPNPELPEISIEENDNSTSLEELKQEVHQGSPIDRPEGSRQSETLKETRVNLQDICITPIIVPNVPMVFPNQPIRR